MSAPRSRRFASLAGVRLLARPGSPSARSRRATMPPSRPLAPTIRIIGRLACGHSAPHRSFEQIVFTGVYADGSNNHWAASLHIHPGLRNTYGAVEPAVSLLLGFKEHL